MMKQITPGAPKIKFMRPKARPPTLLLNHEKNIEEEEEEYFLIEMDEIDNIINEKKLSENENKNPLVYISEYYKDRLNLINNSIKSKLSLCQQRNSNISFDTKCSEKELLNN